MFCKTFIFAFLAVGALAVKLELTDRVRSSFISKLTVLCKPADGSAEHYAEQLTNSVQSFLDCIHPLLDTDTVTEELKTAKTNGAFDEVVKKYSAKAPDFRTCLHTLIDSASPCVEESAKNELTLVKNATDQFIDFVSYKNGDRIIQFLNENGPECVQSKTTEINKCAETVDTQVDGSLKNAVSLTLTEKCGKFDQLSTCIFKALETCTSPAPGKLLESLYKYVREGTSCNDVLPLPTSVPHSHNPLERQIDTTVERSVDSHRTNNGLTFFPRHRVLTPPTINDDAVQADFSYGDATVCEQ